MSAQEPARNRELCADCGLPATGFAYVEADRYCHGDLDEPPTCYERAVRRYSAQRELVDEWARG